MALRDSKARVTVVRVARAAIKRRDLKVSRRQVEEGGMEGSNSGVENEFPERLLS